MNYVVEAIVDKKVNRKTSIYSSLLREGKVLSQVGRLRLQSKYLGTNQTSSITLPDDCRGIWETEIMGASRNEEEQWRVKQNSEQEIEYQETR